MRLTLLFILLCITIQASAQDINPTDIKPTTIPAPDTTHKWVFTLGEVEITATNIPATTNEQVSQAQMMTYDKTDVSHALDLLPGVSLTGVGPRNESTVYVQGFQLRQVPVFIDGIPVYVPYDGYVDLARFTTFDLSEVNVATGNASVLYGANIMGGAINLVSRRPVNKLEIDGATDVFSGDGVRSSINVGSNLGKFYIIAGASVIKSDYVPLSHHFDTTNARQHNFHLNNSNQDDKKVNVKIGFTPSKNSEYTLSYINQNGEKGNPVYLGDDVQNSLYAKPRYWEWPYWNKQSLYFISKTKLGEHAYLKAHAYYDRFTNELRSFDNNTYTSQLKPYAFNSFYNDYTYGASLEYGTHKWKHNELKAAAHFKQDTHRENENREDMPDVEPLIKDVDNTFSFGVEDTYTPCEHLSIVPGVSYNIRNSVEAQNFNSATNTISPFPANDNSAWNAQVVGTYALTSMRRLSLSVAEKTRFATIKDRYSYSLGTAIPNPTLKPEQALNDEISYTDMSVKKVKLQANVFVSNLSNVIQSVNNIEPGLSQMQNTGKALFYGADAGIDYTLCKPWHIGADYTYIHRENTSNESIKFTDVPDNKVFAYIEYRYKKVFTVNANAEYNSQRYSTSYGTIAGAFTLINARAEVHAWKYFSVEGGINNIFDVNYSLVEGYPAEGRNYFAGIIYRFSE